MLRSTAMVATTGLRRIGIERELGDLADANAVEQDRGADQQSGHGTIEVDLVGLALPKAAFVLQPIDEGEARQR